MPNEKVIVTSVNNGPGDLHDNELHIQWGRRGAVPEAPDGWVNQGYALMYIERSNADKPIVIDHYVELTPETIDRLMGVLRRMRSQITDPLSGPCYYPGCRRPGNGIMAVRRQLDLGGTEFYPTVVQYCGTEHRRADRVSSAEHQGFNPGRRGTKEGDHPYSFEDVR